MRKEIFSNQEFYHVYNRGVDKRTIFLEERDYERFVLGLHLFNDTRMHDYNFSSLSLRGLASCKLEERDLLVDILHWCLMPNHFHLFLKQRKDKGISIFMHKLSTGYTTFFNRKRQRTGGLFEGSFRARYVDKDDYFSHLGAYITTNHLDLCKPSWKEHGMVKKEIVASQEFLLGYKWSSFQEYFGQPLLPKLSSPSIFYEVFGGSQNDFKDLISEYLSQGVSVEHEA